MPQNSVPSFRGKVDPIYLYPTFKFMEVEGPLSIYYLLYCLFRTGDCKQRDGKVDNTIYKQLICDFGDALNIGTWLKLVYGYSCYEDGDILGEMLKA